MEIILYANKKLGVNRGKFGKTRNIFYAKQETRNKHQNYLPKTFIPI